MPRKKKLGFDKGKMCVVWIRKTNRARINRLLRKKRKELSRVVTQDEIITDLLKRREK